MKAVVSCLFLFLNFAMAEPEVQRIRYAVVGDSYSCGEGASPKESWPALMTQHLNAQGLHVDLVSNPSVTGWTTKDAIDRELPKFVNSNPNFATLLIGVNDWVQGIDETTFRNRFSYLLDQMLAVLPNKNHLLVVTIHDFEVTTISFNYSSGRSSYAGITQVNLLAIQEPNKRGLYVDFVIQYRKQLPHDSAILPEA